MGPAAVEQIQDKIHATRVEKFNETSIRAKGPPTHTEMKLVQDLLRFGNLRLEAVSVNETMRQIAISIYVAVRWEGRAFKRGAERSGFPPESPGVRRRLESIDRTDIELAAPSVSAGRLGEATEQRTVPAP